jgi:DNA topoisomerase-2
MSTDVAVDLTIKFAPDVISSLLVEETEYGCNALEKLLKLYTTRTSTNMHMFDEKEKLRKFKSVTDIIDHYIGVRLGIYVERKKAQVATLTREANILSNKARFISEILDDTLDLRKKKKAVVSAILASSGYSIVDQDEDFKYLVRLPMDSVTEENAAKILKERDDKLAELEGLKVTSEKDIWLSELELLRKEYLAYRKGRELIVADPGKKKKRKLKLKTKAKA